jgi:hypothetical protein
MKWFISEKCVGVSTLRLCGKFIARALELPNCEEFTGHCFKRTAGTLQAEGGVPSRNSNIK